MEATDHQLIEKLSQRDFELRKLYERHSSLERRLDRFKNRPFLSASEEVEARRLKKQKLFGVDRMMRILARHRIYRS